MASPSVSHLGVHDMPTENVANVLRDGLEDCFEEVHVQVAPCPDLKMPPFGLLSPGISGQNVICDVGSMSYLLPVADVTKRYTFDQVVESTKLRNGQLFGAGAGPFFTHGKNCEMAACLQFTDGEISVNSTLHGVYDNKAKTPYVIKATDNNFALLGHLFATEGLPGSVIEVDVSSRIKEGAIYAFLREALTAAYGELDKPVALGGVLVLSGSKARFHVLPEFPDHPVDSPARVAEFLKFFEMDPPVLGMGTLLSHDPYGIDLKLEHFHCYNEAKNLAGHFYWDTEPEKANYHVYLTVAKSLLRIDPKKK